MALQLLRESFQISAENIQSLPLNESTKLIEVNGKSYKCRGAYLVETSRYDFLNENDRLYPFRLWERVIKEQKGTWEGGNGLADHPEKEGSTKNIFSIWHNLRLNEQNKTVMAEMYLVGEDGQRAKEILEAGGKIELSSSGYGEISESDNKTVIAESYILERVADWVLNASQKVYATKDNEMHNENKNNNNSIKKVTIKEVSNIMENHKENLNMDGKISKVNEKSLRLNIKNMLKEIDKKSNLKSKLVEYREILTYCDEDFLKDLKEEIIKKIVGVNKQIETLAIQGLKTPELEKTVNDTTKKLTESEVQLKALKEQHEKLVKKFEVAKKLLTESKIGVTKLNKITQLEKANSNSKVKAEDYILIAKENNSLKEEVKKLKVENKYLTIKVNSFKKIKEEDKADDKETDADKDGDDKTKDDDKKEENKLTKSSTKIDEQEDEDSKEDEEEDDKKDKEKDDKKEESIEMNFREDDKVKDYFSDLTQVDERYIPFKKEILTCKTLKEATLKALKLKDKIENFTENVEENKIEESTTSDYVFPKKLEGVDISRLTKNRKGWF